MITKKLPLIGKPADSSRDYRNIFDDAAPHQPYAGCGVRNQNRRMFRWLATRFKAPYDWPEGRGDNDNRSIPAGYTYLAQFVIHDTIQSDLPDFSDGPAAPRNNRSARLVLDTIYGKGPGSDPLFYAPIADPLPYFGPPAEPAFDLQTALDTPSVPGFLRIGSGRANDGDDAATFPSRDLPRRACPFAGVKPASDVLIADTRNDDNVIVSQITVLFHLLHNLVFARLKQNNDRRGGDQRQSNTRIFSRARKVVTQIYRTIVFDDLLARLLHPVVYERYCSGGAAVLLDHGDGRMPLEFSHAAARFGHCMVRDSYAINSELGSDGQVVNVLRQTSAGRAFDMPLTARWLIDWTRLFEKDGSVPLFSRRIGPVMTESLVENDFVRDTGLAQDPAWRRGDIGGLAYRDLVRGAESGLRSTGEIVGALPNWVCALSPLTRAGAGRKCEMELSAVRKWLAREPQDGTSEPEIAQYIECLLADLPLLPFLLIEAAETKGRSGRNGECLGAVGSVILAEFFFREFWRTYPLIEGDPEVASAYREAVDAAAIDSMPKLIALISEKMNWNAAQQKFW